MNNNNPQLLGLSKDSKKIFELFKQFLKLLPHNLNWFQDTLFHHWNHSRTSLAGNFVLFYGTSCCSWYFLGTHRKPCCRRWTDLKLRLWTFINWVVLYFFRDKPMVRRLEPNCQYKFRYSDSIGTVVDCNKTDHFDWRKNHLWQKHILSCRIDCSRLHDTSSIFRPLFYELAYREWYVHQWNPTSLSMLHT